jgi:hypothetical protein
VVLSGILALPIGQAALAQSNLKSRRDVQTRERPVWAIVADLDADGILDLVSVNQSTNDLGVLKGFGDGTFRALHFVAVSSRPSAAALADATGDGRPDLITANLFGQDVTVNPGDGMGGFGARISTPVNGLPASLTVGDWNGDGRIDVATVNTSNNNVSALLGDGTGRFTTLRQFAVGSSPRQIVSGDFNADGRLDLAVVSNTAQTVQVYRNDGNCADTNGCFTTTASNVLSTGASPVALIAAHFNGDTRLDLAIGNAGGDSVSIYLANTQGGFSGPTTLTGIPAPRGLMAADVSRDGRLDLVVASSKVSGIGQVAVLNGDGAGGFGAPVFHGTAPNPVFSVSGDVNRDGSPDLVVVSPTANVLSILENTGSGGFVAAPKIQLPSGAFPHGIAVADFNRDNCPDLATANEALNNVSIINGNCQGGFTVVSSANNTGITPFAIAQGDFNRDLCPDLVTANNGDNTLSYLQGNCAGNFTVTNGPATGCAEEEDAVDVSVGEISGDLFRDLGFACQVGGRLCTRRGTGASGTSAFGAPVCSLIGGRLVSVALGTYNLDALEDAALTASDQNAALIAFSDGSGGIVDIPGAFLVGTMPRGIVQGLLNQDSYRDLVVANSGSGTISGLLGDGGGVFSVPSIDSQVGLAPTAIALADYNLDGHLDAAVANSNANNVSLMLGDGSGRFYKAGDFGARDQPIAIGAGDFNRDGKPDLAVADLFSDSVTVLLNMSLTGDPLQVVSVVGGGPQFILRWGMVPGATYDVIRGQVRSVTQEATIFNLGPVTCLANDLAVTDTADSPDTSIPPLGDSYFYAVRAVVGGVAGQYTVSTNGKPGVPASGGCP